jgi:uncharacterized membrane protein
MEVSISDSLRAFLRLLGQAETHKDSIDLDKVLELVNDYNSKYPDKLFDISDVMKDCHVLKRSTKATPTNTDSSLTEIQAIRKKAEEKRFQRLLQSNSLGKTASIQSEIQELRKSGLLVAHFIMAVIGAWLCGYFSTTLFLEWKAHHGVLAGGAAAIFVLLVEVTLFIIRENKESKKTVKKIS